MYDAARSVGPRSQAPAESIRQWVHRETRRQERATHTPAGEPIEKLFESRTRSLQELRDLQLGLHMRMQARATGSLGRSAATTSGVAQVRMLKRDGFPAFPV